MLHMLIFWARVCVCVYKIICKLSLQIFRIIFTIAQQFFVKIYV